RLFVRRRQFTPYLTDGGQRPCFRIVVGQNRPNPRQIFRTQARLGGEVAQFRVGSAEQPAMVILPGGQKIVGEINLVMLIEIEDAFDEKFVAVGVGHGRVRGEDKAVRLQDDVVSYPPRRRQVFLE